MLFYTSLQDKLETTNLRVLQQWIAVLTGREIYTEADYCYKAW